MEKIIGVTNVLYSDEIKSQALFFDSLTHPLARTYHAELEFQDIGMDAKLRDEVSWLFENGIFIDVTDKAGFTPEKLFYSLMLPLSEGINVKDIENQLDVFVENTKKWSSTTKMAKVRSSSQILVHPTGMFVLPDDKDPRKRVENMFGLMDNTITPTARLLATWLRKYKNVNAYPVLTEFTSEFSKPANFHKEHIADTKTDVLNIIIKEMPKPDKSVSWEQIIDFRNDTDSQGKILALRNWINKTARSGATYLEIQDELHWLLYDYERHLKLHKMKHNAGTLEAIVVTSAELLEDIAKLSLGDAAKKIFSVRHRQVELLESEMENPGAEVAYIYKAKNKFSNKKG